jgi:hypothetical protein
MVSEAHQLSKKSIYSVWAPRDAKWTPWVKPVAFACIEYFPAPVAGSSPDTSWAPTNDPHTAIVVDLPGGDGVWAGIDLARRGYRPVPLYNALPGPVGYRPSIEDEGGLTLPPKTAGFESS